MLLSKLPYELQENIISNLSDEDLVSYFKINKSAYSLSKNGSFWNKRAKKMKIPNELLISNIISMNLYFKSRWYVDMLTRNWEKALLLAVKDNDIPIIDFILTKTPSLKRLIKIIYNVIPGADAIRLIDEIYNKRDILTFGDKWLLCNLVDKMAELSCATEIIYISNKIIPDIPTQSLEISVTSGNFDLTQILIKNILYYYSQYNTAIHRALEIKRYDIFEYLVDNYPVDGSNLNLLFTAYPLPLTIDVINKLISKGFTNYTNLLYIAVRDKDHDIVNYLLNNHNFSKLELKECLLDQCYR